MLPDTIALRWTMVFAALTGLAVAVMAWLVIPTPRLHLGSGGDWTHTAAGPVGPADRALLAALRQDSLWEVPVGQQAQEMAVDPAVRQVGGTVATDLGWLSGQVRALADRLGVVLPSQPTPDQQSWLVEIASKSGPDYDRTMVNRLRSACADSLQAITRAASTTRNEQVRQLADQAGQVVGRHIRYLDDLRLPGSAAVPSQTPAAGLGSVDGGNGPDRTLVALTVLVALAAAIAVLGLVWLVRFGPRPHWPVWSRRSVGSRGPWPGGGPRWPVRGARWPGGGPRWLLGPRRPFGPRRPLGPRRPVGPPPPVELGSRGPRRPW